MRPTRSLGGRILLAVLVCTLAAAALAWGAQGDKEKVRVMKDSPAKKAGLQKGDVILQFDGHNAKSVRSLTADIEDCEPGESKTIVIQRDGDKKTLSVVVGKGESEDEFTWTEDVTPPPPGVPDMGEMRLPDAPRAFAFSLGELSNSRIGVSLYELSDQLADYFGAKDGGALINEVIEDGPAAKAGLKAGDVIVQVDHKSVKDVSAVRRAIQKKDGGDVATVTVLRRGNEEKTVDVTVEESESWSGVGDNRFFRVQPRNAHPLPGDQMAPAMRRAQRAMRDSNSDLREEMKQLREELNQLKKELREKGN
ncbi:MAG: PDZ domain-containing protein [candidate division Zixibacteria bacterium]|nr:PDZ domain-containing protein [candidate division Zixibacteria bacterium]